MTSKNNIKKEDNMGELEQLKKELEVIKKERDEYLSGWQRARADAINERDSLQKQTTDSIRESIFYFIEEFIPSIDSMDKAIEQADDETFKKGLIYVREGIQQLFKKYGVIAEYPINESFDPEKHSSIGSISVDEKEKDNHVVEVIRTGYYCEGRVIRPAEVKVGVYKK